MFQIFAMLPAVLTGLVGSPIGSALATKAIAQLSSKLICISKFHGELPAGVAANIFLLGRAKGCCRKSSVTCDDRGGGIADEGFRSTIHSHGMGKGIVEGSARPDIFEIKGPVKRSRGFIEPNTRVGLLLGGVDIDNGLLLDQRSLKLALSQVELPILKSPLSPVDDNRKNGSGSKGHSAPSNNGFRIAGGWALGFLAFVLIVFSQRWFVRFLDRRPIFAVSITLICTFAAIGTALCAARLFAFVPNQQTSPFE